MKLNPHRAIVSSSPDRNLLAALMAWPAVRLAVPDAELHCFYGWGNQEASAKMAGDHAQLARIAHLKQLARGTAGVVLRGRVNQSELAREFMRAGVWLHCTWFSETSCIGAMEAQAAGMHIVCTPVAALVETVGDRGVMMAEKWEDPERPSDAFVAEMAKLTVEALRRAEGGPNEYAMEYARSHFSLDALADEWDRMLTELYAERLESPVAKFEERAAE